MNEKEVAEIRRRFKLEKNGITHIRGCYVNERGEITSQFNQSLGLMSQEETEMILATLRRTLSGRLGKNLTDITFATGQVADSDEHRLLMALRESSLEDNEAVQTFFDAVIKANDLEGNYLILLAKDAYDIPFRSRDGANQDDASSEVFSYLLCSVCPVKMTKSALGYHSHENAFHCSKPDWVVASPELGFLFPAFNDRATDLYGALYYSRNTSENHQDFVDAIFHTKAPMPPAIQKETFQSILEETLADQCSYEVVQAVQDTLCEMIETHKERREPDAPAVSKGEVKKLLSTCGVSEDHTALFEEKYDDAFGAETALNPQNIVDPKQMEICTPDITIQVNPERSDLIETRTINGAKYIMIRADEGVEVNGVNVHIS